MMGANADAGQEAGPGASPFQGANARATWPGIRIWERCRRQVSAELPETKGRPFRSKNSGLGHEFKANLPANKPTGKKASAQGIGLTDGGGLGPFEKGLFGEDVDRRAALRRAGFGAQHCSDPKNARRGGATYCGPGLSQKKFWRE